MNAAPVYSPSRWSQGLQRGVQVGELPEHIYSFPFPHHIKQPCLLWSSGPMTLEACWLLFLSPSLLAWWIQTDWARKQRLSLRDSYYEPWWKYHILGIRSLDPQNLKLLGGDTQTIPHMGHGSDDRYLVVPRHVYSSCWEPSIITLSRFLRDGVLSLPNIISKLALPLGLLKAF